MKKIALVLCVVLLLTIVSCKDGVDISLATGSSSLRIIRINNPQLDTGIARYKISIKDSKDKEYEYIINSSGSFTIDGLSEGQATFSLVVYDSNDCILCSGENFTQTLKKGKTVSVIVDGNEMHWRNADWGITENGLLMLRPGKKVSGVVKLPEVGSIDSEYGVKAERIGIECFKGQTEITAVIIPSGYISISDGAFSGCSKMVCVVMPETVEQIGNSAFRYCSKLKSVTTDVSIMDSFNVSTFDKRDFKLPNKISIIRNYCFQNCVDLTTVDMPLDLTTIGSYAFAGCSKITNIAIPSKVKTIESCAFYGCSKLTSLTFKTEILTTIGNSAFSECKKLEKIDLPESVVSIGSYAFSGCEAFIEFKVPSKVKSISSGLFNCCTELKKVTLPSGIDSIGERAFAWNKSLEEINPSEKYKVIIPSSVKLLDNLAFDHATKIVSMFIPSSVETIGYEAFNGMTGKISFAASKDSDDWNDSLAFTGFAGTKGFGAQL